MKGEKGKKERKEYKQKRMEAVAGAKIIPLSYVLSYEEKKIQSFEIYKGLMRFRLRFLKLKQRSNLGL